MDYNKIRRQEHKVRYILRACGCAAAALAVIAGGIFVGVHRHDKATTDTTDAVVTTSPRQDTYAAAVTTPLPTPIPAIQDEPTAAAAAETEATEYIAQTPTEAPTTRRGTSEVIPQDIREYMSGKSMHENDDISFDDLRYLTIPHYDFNYEVTQGHMVVNAAVAEDVLDIFAELYDVKYPIERMELVDAYGADDYESIDNNNTSAFNYRESTDGTGRLSKHALGRAIDINPQINPYVNSDGTGSHENAREYWDRDYTSWSSAVARAAYIGPGSQIYDIFIAHGWEWGGSWSSYRDYQHFQKQ